ncbi:PilT/PilU family type 4a pilus ATPase [Haliea sp.]|jgi:twitching motility protein PilU|uniref:PilT/PilU family type 4a pilus ATPase n=1 Tax=Haliea TaxID=475794 RepID=UPI000C551230|nr:PilT/PilU family type 4a pilus ATPase [Haliea sp.]HBX74113.1 type IV pili twitching motility protein PilT [Halieaceae bacterium]MAD64115.1 type IV pili twitching motility protein PilT [Haliea sp.]MAY92521.1 type IV pili twitching motility protein PilT [Haliea sp.]MBK40851.1 type IV pili twitching motility protein PilT [Haliea sp.]MBP68574.1 type IV pili twitching motility protein PilT [Haliea sp.]|tara:strand:- start:13631 stop:14767 length:1137 start_codon:yes stop_codon:yes gene_type:complete
MLIDELLQRVVKEQASDGFVTAGAPPSIKIDGQIYPISKARYTDEQTRDIVLSTMNERQREEFLRSHECNFALAVPNLGRFRVNALVQRGSMSLVVRRIHTEIPEITELGLPPIIKELAMTKRGLVIFVGATGTGKSTSLAAMVGYRNQNSRGHIISIEDPIEFMHDHGNCLVTQREVGIDTESFDVALKNTLRQAPDVIMIGEVRSADTMAQALTFAETGHLCLCTLHANNANQALDRIQSFFPADLHSQVWMDLSLNLKAMVAQQLLPHKEGKGRTPVVEVLLNSPLIQDYIRKGDVHLIKDVMAKSTEQGMQTMDQSLIAAYKDNRITREDAVRYADSANDVRLMIKMFDKGQDSGADDLDLSFDDSDRGKHMGR